MSHDLRSHAVTEGSRGRDVKREPWMNADYWLAPHGLFSTLYSPRPQGRGSIAPSGLGPPQFIISQEDAPRPDHRPADGGIFSLEVPFYQEL